LAVWPVNFHSTGNNRSKGADKLLSKSMAVKLGPDNIRVNAICPVIGGTGLPEQFMGVPDTPQNRAKCMATIPPGGRGLRWSGGSRGS
jgi:3-oxoacyl-[acyl-carrier protein] reductase